MWNSFFKCPKGNQYSYEVYDSIVDVDKSLWGVVGDKNIYLTVAYLEAFEKGMQKQMKFRYAVFLDQYRRCVGVSVFQVVGFRLGDFLQNKIPNTLANSLRKLFFEEKKLRMLICGNLFACGENGFWFQEEIPPKFAFKTLFSVMEKICLNMGDASKVSFTLFKEYWSTPNKVVSEIKEHHFVPLDIDVNMVLKLNSNWKCFEDYLLAMNTKYRTRAKNVFKSSSSLIKMNFGVEDIVVNLDRIEELYKEVLDKAEYNLGVLEMQTFVCLKEHLKENFVFTAYLVDKKLIGFSTAFVFDSVLDANFIGIDYSCYKKHKLYQRMLYDFVSLSIEKEALELRLGRTAETIKSGIGAVPVSMRLYVRHRNCLSTSLLKPLVASIEPSEYEIRNPYKN